MMRPDEILKIGWDGFNFETGEGPLPPADPQTDEEWRALVRWVNATIRVNEISRARLAHRLGVAVDVLAAAVSSGARQRTPEDNDIVRRAMLVLRADAAPVEDQRPVRFIETTLSKRVFGALGDCRSCGGLAALWSPPGTGKRVTSEVYCQEVKDAMLVRVHPGNRLTGAFLKDLWCSYAKTPTAPFGGRVQFSELLRRLQHSQRLLIVHGAERCSAEVLGMLATLHDHGVAVAMLGTIDLLRKLCDDARGDGDIASRISMRCELLPELSGRRARWVSSDQVRRMFCGGERRISGDALQRLTDAGNWEPGFLRRALWMYRRGEQLADVAGRREIALRDVEDGIAIIDGVGGPTTPRDVREQTAGNRDDSVFGAAS